MRVRNLILSNLFNRLDLPVRFLYTQAGFVSHQLNRLLFWKLYASDLEKLDEKFRKVQSILEGDNIRLRGKVVLELGPGNSYLNAYHFLMQGAQRVILVDKYPRFIETPEQKKYYLEELEFIRREYEQNTLGFLKENNKLDSNFIKFITGDLVDTKDMEPATIDFIYSVSVLEHVKDVEGNIDKMAQLLKPGGYMYHHIDLRDHYNFSEPFLFYKYSDWVWENLLTREGLSYTNRWRYGEFLEEFRKNGLAVVNENLKRFGIKETKMAERFWGRDDLEVGILDIVLQKKL